MKLKFNRLLVLFLALISQLALAQEKSVSGTVTDASGAPLPGVNVLVKGTTKGVATEFDGSFNIKASTKDVLVFSFMGMKTIEMKAGTNMKIVMQDDAVQMADVVVTAFGIKRKPKDLGYSVNSVKTDEITENSEPDLTRALSGKVAGVNVNMSTGVAGASNIVTIRGINTFDGNVQPLIIVDGIAYSNTQVTSSNQVTGGGGYQSGLSSLDPNDILSIDVLKSAAASALYGSRAANGVIVVTTKSGSAGKGKKGKLSVNIGMGNYFENIANLPEFQNTYGAGTNFSYANANGSWGPKFGTLATIPTWPTILAAFPSIGPTVPYEAKPDNVKNLFRTGLVQDKTMSLNYAGEDGGFGMTASRMDQEGYIPYNDFSRISFSSGGNFKLGKKLGFGANQSYSKTEQNGGFFGENQFAGSSSSFARTFFMARNWDTSLPYEDAAGKSLTPNGAQFDHPLWSWKHDRIITDTERIVLGANIDYKFNNNISAVYRFGYNKYNLHRDEIRDLNSRANNGLGRIQKNVSSVTDLESTLMFNFDYKLSDNIGLTAIVGGNVLQNKTSDYQIVGTEFLHPNIFTLKNSKNVITDFDIRDQKRNLGVFSDVTISFKEYLFINATGRNEVSSTLPKNNNNYFYPSVSGSFIITEALKLDNKYFNFGKLRGSFAQLGVATSAEFLNLGYNTDAQPYGGLPLMENNRTFPDQNIKPQFTTEIELGADLEFFNKRLSVDFTHYNKKTKDIISSLALPKSTGYAFANTNAITMENKGIELGVTIIPLQNNNFKWTLTSNYSHNRNKVTDLSEGIERLNLRANTVAFAIVGEPYGVFYGSKFARDKAGNFLINQNGGAIIQDPTPGIIGDPNADFKVSFINTFKYKNLSLRGQVDWKQGGDIHSTTIQSLLGRGVTRDTEDREKSFIIPGFYGDNNGNPILDSNGNQIPNTIQLSMNELYFSPAGGNTFAINSVDEASVYDGTVFRLREINLTYDFSNKVAKKLMLSNLSISFIGNNLWYFAPNVPKYTNFDPEIASIGSAAAQGIEIAAAPTAKRYGFKINLTF